MTIVPQVTTFKSKANMNYDNEINCCSRIITATNSNNDTRISGSLSESNLTRIIIPEQCPNNAKKQRRFGLDSTLTIKIKEYFENRFSDKSPTRAKDELDITLRNYSISPHVLSEIMNRKKMQKRSSFGDTDDAVDEVRIPTTVSSDNNGGSTSEAANSIMLDQNGIPNKTECVNQSLKASDTSKEDSKSEQLPSTHDLKDDEKIKFDGDKLATPALGNVSNSSQNDDEEKTDVLPSMKIQRTDLKKTPPKLKSSSNLAA